MNTRKIFFILLASSILFPAMASSQMPKFKQKPKRAYAAVQVEVFEQWDVQKSKPIRVNCLSAITWKGVPASYGTVWLQICKPDKRSCGGRFPTRNDGQYEHKFGISEAGEEWVVKVYTQDNKYKGYSRVFLVDGMATPCP